MSPDLLATVYRLAIIAVGGLSIVLAYKLFRTGVFEVAAQELKLKFGPNKILVKAAAPGTVLGLFGMGMIVVSVLYPPKFQGSETTIAQSTSTATPTLETESISGATRRPPTTVSTPSATPVSAPGPSSESQVSVIVPGTPETRTAMKQSDPSASTKNEARAEKRVEYVRTYYRGPNETPRVYPYQDGYVIAWNFGRTESGRTTFDALSLIGTWGEPFWGIRFDTKDAAQSWLEEHSDAVDVD
jgi:hypothetical protein